MAAGHHSPASLRGCWRRSWVGTGAAARRFATSSSLTGPAARLFEELKRLKSKIEIQRSTREVQDKGLADIFQNVRTYIFSRNDF